MQTYNLNPVNVRNWLVNGHQTTHGLLSEFSDKDDNKNLVLSSGNGQTLGNSQKKSFLVCLRHPLAHRNDRSCLIIRTNVNSDHVLQIG
jgi:hypothetical protein